MAPPVAHRLERGFDHPVHFGVLAHEVAGHADPRALEAVGVQVLGVVPFEAALALLGGGVGRIDAGHDAERDGDVGHVAGHRPAGIEAEGQRDDAVAAEQPMGRLETDDAVRRGRPAHRPAGVGAQAEHRVAGGNRHAGAARRSRRRPGRVVRVARLPAQRAEGATRRELRQVDLGDDHGPCLAQLPHHERVVGRDRSVEEDRPASSGQVGGVEVVLEDDRDAVQQRLLALGLAFGIQRPGRFERPGIEREHRVQQRALLVVGLDARQPELHQPLRGERAGVHRRGQLRDRRRVEVDRLPLPESRTGRRQPEQGRGRDEGRAGDPCHSVSSSQL